MQDESTTKKSEIPKRKRGRPKGVPDSRPRRPLGVTVRALAESGELPLDYMLRVMRDTRVKTPRRDQMAKNAAPYCHPTFASVKMNHGLPPLSQLVAGMKPDDIPIVESFFRIVERLQSERLAISYQGGTSPPTG